MLQHKMLPETAFHPLKFSDGSELIFFIVSGRNTERKIISKDLVRLGFF